MDTEGTTLLIITQVRSGFKKLHPPMFCKYKYLYVKICSLVIVKSMQVVVILNAKLDHNSSTTWSQNQVSTNITISIPHYPAV